MHSFSDYNITGSNIKDLLNNLWVRLLSTNNIPENSPLYRIWNSEVTVNQLKELYQKRTPDRTIDPSEHRRNPPEPNSTFRYTKAIHRGKPVDPQLLTNAQWANGSNGHIGMIILNDIDDMIENGVNAEIIMSEAEFRNRYPLTSPFPPSSPVGKPSPKPAVPTALDALGKPSPKPAVPTALYNFLYDEMPRVHGYQYDGEIIEVTGDGACFFNAVALQFFDSEKTQMEKRQMEKRQVEIRHKVADLFRDERYIIKRFGSEFGIGSKEHLLARLNTNNLESYIQEKILREYEEVDEEDVIQAVADACSLHIVIWDEVSQRSIPYRSLCFPLKGKIFLLRRRIGGHSYHYEIFKSHRI